MAARKARKISIHALREEGDSLPVSLPQLNVRISIHALREEGDPDASLILGRVIAISIHALREEGDDLGPRDRRSPSNFYPRPPRGGRQVAMFRLIVVIEFLSTPSARRATVQKYYEQLARGDFYPRPPRGGRPHDVAFVGQRDFISIHALREEGDRGSVKLSLLVCLFLSTPSARRATALSPCLFELFLISIHALREEGDAFASNIEVEILNFYPRPPRGGRPIDQQAEIDSYLISIHALREEGDTGEIRRKDRPVYFYPRPPRGGRQKRRTEHACDKKFLSTPSARRATKALQHHLTSRQISIHALREEGDFAMLGQME